MYPTAPGRGRRGGNAKDARGGSHPVTPAAASLVDSPSRSGNPQPSCPPAMEPTFPPSMLMFTHLPPVTTFARMGSDLLPSPLPPPIHPGPGDMSLKKEPGSPSTAEYLHGMNAIKQEKVGDLDQYQFYGDRSNEILEVTVGSQPLHPDMSFTRELLLRAEKNSYEPKQSVKKTRRRAQEAKSKRRRNKSCDGDMSPNYKPHICQHCHASFRSSYHLRRHVLIHTGERPFECGLCNMTFIQKYLLQRHHKIHSGEKPFTCDQCNMKFIQKYHMERHKRTHSGEKPYKCDSCHQFFSRTDRLLKHRRTCSESINKGALNPGPSNPGLNNLSGNFDLSQGSSNVSVRKKTRTKNGSSNKNPKSGSKMNEAHIAADMDLQNYAVDVPMMSGNDPSGTGLGDLNTKLSKMGIKKGGRKQAQKNDLSLDSQSTNLAMLKLSDKANSPHDMVSTSNVDSMNLLQTSGNKGPTSSNYDDAMQFLKKKRYLPSTGSNNAYAVNVAHMVSQQSVIQSSVSNVMDGDSQLTLIDSNALNVDIKNCHDKSVISDEVFQSFLDHYTHKSVVHPDVTFSLGEQHMELQTANANDLVQEENICTVSQSTPNDKASLLQEYSKCLQQALERTSQTPSFPLGPSLQFVGFTSSVPSPSLFADKLIYTTSPLDCGFGQTVTSVLPPGLPKSNFGMVLGPQTGFSLSLDTSQQQLTPSQELADQIDSQKPLDTSSSYQISSQELNGQKDQQKSMDNASGFHLQPQDLASSLEQQKDDGPQVTYQIETFAQAFGPQFKSGNRVPILFNTSTDGGMDQRLRNSTSEFSGYSTLLSDVSEAGSTQVKSTDNQSFR
ncbi:zinc finger protein 281 isoform X2 [Pyxicephalus adspersus]|uniref:zinc finger protein 281 isoform X2 n=1 Tax=Pyxicephalus adspersus TaxID=30357 RepID=UPI003B5D05F0